MSVCVSAVEEALHRGNKDWAFYLKLSILLKVEIRSPLKIAIAQNLLIQILKPINFI